MKRIILGTYLIFGLWLVGNAQPSDYQQIDELAQNYVKKSKNQGLVVAFVRQGQSVIKGYGTKGKGDPSPPDGQTIFEIGALTSVFTTSLTVYESLEGHVDLQAPVQTYLPENREVPTFQAIKCVEITLPDSRHRIVSCAPDPLAEALSITLCDLASHVSGLPCSEQDWYAWNPFVTIEYRETYQDRSKTAMYDCLSKVELQTAPGSKFRYSSPGIALLGNILSDARGISYEDLLKQNITGPLNMPDTRLVLTAEQGQRFIQGYDWKGKPTDVWHFDAMAPAAGLRSSATDLLVFLQANLQPASSTLGEAFEQAQQPRLDVSFPGWDRLTQAGYGWLVSLLSEESNLPVTWINGGTGGFRAFMGFIKPAQTGVILLSNSAEPVDEMGWQILELLSK